MTINIVLNYIYRIAPSISYWKILAWSLILIILFEVIVFCVNKKRTEKLKPFRVAVYGLIFYSNFVLRLTLLGRELGVDRTEPIRLHVSIGDILSVHGILNMLMFVPFGFFVYAVLRNYEIPTKVLLAVMISMIFTLMIEMIQLATQSGRFEIDDMISNTIGGLLGCFPSYILFDLLFPNNDED